MMHDLNDMTVFAAVADAGGFTAAAERLRLPKSTVSRRVSRLEKALGMKLLERTTRRLRVTEAGGLYLKYCERIRAEAEQAELAVQSLFESPRGEIRMSVSLDIGQGLLVPALGEFLRRYPEVRVCCELSNRRVDLVAEGFDLAIRIGRLEDSSLIARRLGETAPRLYASPAYLAGRGVPNSPEELAGHDLLAMSDSATTARWKLNGPSGSVNLALSPRAVVNDFTSVMCLAIQGAGIALLPPYLCHGKEEQLQLLLAHWTAPAAEITALYPSHRGATPKVRALLDFIAERFPALL